MTVATYKLLVDWDNDGLYAHANSNVTADVLELSFSRGRDRASQLTGKSLAGTLETVLRNVDGKYNPFQTASPITGKLLPGRKVKLETNDGFPYTFPIVFGGTALWRGFLDSIEPEPRTERQHKARLRALGPLSRFSGASSKVRAAVNASIRTDNAVAAVLDAAGWPAADRDLAVGQTTMQRWWAVNIEAMPALREIEETEAGFVREMADGKIKFEDRHFRLAGARLTSQATYSDILAATLPYLAVAQQDPLAEIYNIFRASILRQSVGGLVTLWTLGESGASSPPIEPGTSRTWIAEYPGPATASQNFGVNAWTTPVATTDYTLNSLANGTGTDLTGSVTVAVVKGTATMDITITNNAAVVAFLTLLQARGTPLVAETGSGVEVRTAASVTRYGERTYPLAAKFLSDTSEARDNGQFLAGIFDAPIPVLRLEFLANASQDVMAEILTRDISDRVTVKSNFGSDLGIDEDFFVERITHRIDRFRVHRVEMELSPATGYSGFWVLGTSALGITTKLAY